MALYRFRKEDWPLIVNEQFAVDVTASNLSKGGGLIDEDLRVEDAIRLRTQEIVFHRQLRKDGEVKPG